MKDEWTAISDIGKPQYGFLTANNYLRVEDNYWATISYLLKLCHINSLRMKEIEKHHELHVFFTQNKFFNPTNIEKAIQNNTQIGIDEIEIVLRLCLREEMWCKLEGKNNTFIHFGYDYYMFFCTEIEHKIDANFIPEGVYIENFQSPYVRNIFSDPPKAIDRL